MSVWSFFVILHLYFKVLNVFYRFIFLEEVSGNNEEMNHTSTNKNSKKQANSVLADGVIQCYDDHEDSVYVAEWSSADPWTFASLSYDGRLVVNQVPRNIKFKILNLV